MGVPLFHLIARLLLALGLLLATAPAVGARQQSAADCQDLTDQIGEANQQLDQLKQDAFGWLVQSGQYAQSVPLELAGAAQQGGLPFLTPELAASDGGLAALVAAQIDAWREANDQVPSGDYLRDLGGQLVNWRSTLAILAPVQAASPSLTLLDTAFSQLDQVVAGATADQALIDGLNSQLQDCNAQAQAGSDAPQGALCNVEGKAGYSSSDCFSLENDAAYAVWAACTEAYFEAEREAFRTGGDLPVNTCDGAWAAEMQAIQQRWGDPAP
jgi:hypothetical protein